MLAWWRNTIIAVATFLPVWGAYYIVMYPETVYLFLTGHLRWLLSGGILCVAAWVQIGHFRTWVALVCTLLAAVIPWITF